jgi:hypothetical protein
MAAVVGLLGSAGQVLANCQDQGQGGGGIYEVRQCATQAWFDVPPVGAGDVTAAWWQLGFGNNNANYTDPSNLAARGDGIISTYIGVDAACYDSIYFSYDEFATSFIGNDSGSGGAPDLVDAAFIGGPAGALCFSSAANWAFPTVDGCADNNRRGTLGGGVGGPSLDFSDGFLNRYWANSPGVGTLRHFYQVDAPMAALLTESNNVQFALAFFATKSRGASATDISAGEFDMGNIVNGDAGLTGNNIVPWQPIPVANYNNVGDPDADPRTIDVSWAPVRIVDDGSANRPCKSPTNVPCGNNILGGASGVGVFDQCGGADANCLVRYQVEVSGLDGLGNCLNAWSNLGAAVPHPGSSTTVSAPADSCLRLTTIFGRVPQVSIPPGDKCTLQVNAEFKEAQRGKVGDLGYEVSSPSVRVGGALVSERANIQALNRVPRGFELLFDTTIESTITRFDIVGIDKKGVSQVLMPVECQQCNSGVGASYRVLIPSALWKNTAEVQVVLQPSGTGSNIVGAR